MAVTSLQRGNRRALSLIELLVVLFIISIMLGLLLPAVQSARQKAQTTACLNNVRQLRMAISRASGSRNKFFAPNRWTCEILKYIEEWPLADETAGGVAPGTKLARPPIFVCPAQANVPSTVEDTGVCHYVLVMDRWPKPPYNPISGWEIQDREVLSDEKPLEPWYIGPEVSIATQRIWFTNRSGAHPGGLFCMGTGDLRPDAE